jgi:hypothetical protein
MLHTKSIGTNHFVHRGTVIVRVHSHVGVAERVAPVAFSGNFTRANQVPPRSRAQRVRSWN